MGHQRNKRTFHGKALAQYSKSAYAHRTKDHTLVTTKMGQAGYGLWPQRQSGKQAHDCQQQKARCQYSQLKRLWLLPSYENPWIATYIFLGFLAAYHCRKCHSLGPTPFWKHITHLRLRWTSMWPSHSTPHILQQYFQYSSLSTGQLSKWARRRSHFYLLCQGRDQTLDRDFQGEVGQKSKQKHEQKKEQWQVQQFKFPQLIWGYAL